MRLIKAYEDDYYTVAVLQLTQCNAKRHANSFYGFARQEAIAVVVSSSSGNNTYYLGDTLMTDEQRRLARQIIDQVSHTGGPH